MENNLDNSKLATQQDLGQTLDLGQASVGSTLEWMQSMDQSNPVADQLDCGVKEWVDGHAGK